MRRTRPMRTANATSAENPVTGKPQLDRFDRKILQALAQNGRMSNVDIAALVGLSEAPCSRRIRRLEDEGVIRGYSTIIDPEAVGVGVTVFITLVLENFSAERSDEFAREINAIPEIVACHIISGSFDAIIEVMAPSHHAYAELLLSRLRQLSGVKDARSSFVMRTLRKQPGPPLLFMNEDQRPG